MPFPYINTVVLYHRKIHVIRYSCKQVPHIYTVNMANNRYWYWQNDEIWLTSAKKNYKTLNAGIFDKSNSLMRYWVSNDRAWEF